MLSRIYASEFYTPEINDLLVPEMLARGEIPQIYDAKAFQNEPVYRIAAIEEENALAWRTTLHIMPTWAVLKPEEELNCIKVHPGVLVERHIIANGGLIVYREERPVQRKVALPEI